MKFLHSSSGGSSLSYVAIECLIPSWNLFYSLSFSLLTPLFALVLALTSWCVSRLFSYIPKAPIIDPEIRKLRIVKFVVVFVTLRYFDVATIVFKMFSCSNYDPWTDKYYLNSYPKIHYITKNFSFFF